MAYICSMVSKKEGKGRKESKKTFEERVWYSLYKEAAAIFKKVMQRSINDWWGKDTPCF